MAMIKRVISLTEPQDRFLMDRAKQLGISQADMIRRIVDEHRQKEVRNSMGRIVDDPVAGPVQYTGAEGSRGKCVRVIGNMYDGATTIHDGDKDSG